MFKNRLFDNYNTSIQNATDSKINNKFTYDSVAKLPDNTTETYGDDYTTSKAEFTKHLFTF